jgi:hypothetical protein
MRCMMETHISSVRRAAIKSSIFTGRVRDLLQQLAPMCLDIGNPMQWLTLDSLKGRGRVVDRQARLAEDSGISLSDSMSLLRGNARFTVSRTIR